MTVESALLAEAVEVLVSAADKVRLRAMTGAVAADMESAVSERGERARRAPATSAKARRWPHVGTR